MILIPSNLCFFSLNAATPIKIPIKYLKLYIYLMGTINKTKDNKLMLIPSIILITLTLSFIK